MAEYRLYRNIEKSIIDFLVEELSAATPPWTGFRVEKAFSQIHEKNLPAICVNVEEPEIKRIEVGSNLYEEIVTVSIRLFCVDDGQRLDLAHWLTEKVMSGIDYYEYTVANEIASHDSYPDGIINIQKIVASRKELKNTSDLDKKDKFRHLFQFTCKVN